ncbi:hypothetical protein L2E82_51586 [Cichorium intybus]|nr:hypothetical protein L2E82_51586 [Cichorium intybus]
MKSAGDTAYRYASKCSYCLSPLVVVIDGSDHHEEVDFLVNFSERSRRSMRKRKAGEENDERGLKETASRGSNSSGLAVVGGEMTTATTRDAGGHLRWSVAMACSQVSERMRRERDRAGGAKGLGQ